MVTTAWGGAKDADSSLLLIDAERGIRAMPTRILDGCRTSRQPKVLILNKIDRVKHEKLLALAADANGGCRSSAPS